MGCNGLIIRLNLFGGNGIGGYLCRPKNPYKSGNLSGLNAAFV
jgi:hypothetical protein